MQVQLVGQTALVTGATGPIGRAVTLRLAEAGADLAVNCRHRVTEAEALAQQVRSLGRRAVAVQADVTHEADVQRLVSAAQEQLGHLDILINVVGHFLRKPLAETLAGEWEEMLQSNVSSVFYTCKAVLPEMRRRGHGRIVNLGLAGIDAGHGFVQIGAHAVAKTALLALTRFLAKQEAPYGITVNIVSPGFVRGVDMPDADVEALARRIPAGRLASPEEVATAVVFLSSEEASYITGTVLEVAGGWGL